MHGAPPGDWQLWKPVHGHRHPVTATDTPKRARGTTGPAFARAAAWGVVHKGWLGDPAPAAGRGCVQMFDLVLLLLKASAATALALPTGHAEQLGGGEERNRGGASAAQGQGGGARGRIGL